MLPETAIDPSHIVKEIPTVHNRFVVAAAASWERQELSLSFEPSSTSSFLKGRVEMAGVIVDDEDGTIPNRPT